MAMRFMYDCVQSSDNITMGSASIHSKWSTMSELEKSNIVTREQSNG
jgi:hypothetical protein